MDVMKRNNSGATFTCMPRGHYSSAFLCEWWQCLKSMPLGSHLSPRKQVDPSISVMRHPMSRRGPAQRRPLLPLQAGLSRSGAYVVER